MNNPLAQKAQYYLNESSRLSEELNTEIEYSAVLEAVLEELVGTENFLKLITELSDATHTSYRKKATKDLAERGLKARINGMQVGNAAATVAFGNPNAASEENVADLSQEGDANSAKLRSRSRGLMRSERLKPLGGQPLDTQPPAQNGFRSATSRIDVSRRRR